MSLVTICHHMKSHTSFHVMRATCKFHTIILLTMIAHSWAIGVPDSSVGKESGCNAGDLSSIPGLGRSAGDGIGYSFQYIWASLVVQLESACNVGDLGSIPGLGRSPGKGNGNPLQYSCLENSMDRGAWRATVHGVTKSRTWLSDPTYVGFFSLENSTE